MSELYIGAGGWAYFHLPGISSLRAYSKAFNFVEINSTFYEIPDLKEVKRWKKTVPLGFRFSVRAHHSVTHGPSEPLQKVHTSFRRMLDICSALDADILHLQFPPSHKPSVCASRLEGLLKIEEIEGTQLAVEARGENGVLLPSKLLKVMRDYNIVHCVDLVRGEMPAYDSGILYSRIFGKGEHNVYQPDDSELLKVDEIARGNGRTYIAFHGVKMYSDAARLKIFDATGEFPMVTSTTGIGSLESVLNEDVKFPVSKDALIRDQGWKLFDADEVRRVRAGEVLSKLPDRMYENLFDVREELKRVGGIFG